jgi:hypothetical protein
MNKLKIKAFLSFLGIWVCFSSLSAAISLAPIVGAVNRTHGSMVREWAKQIIHLKEQIKELKDLNSIGQKTVDYLALEIENELQQIKNLDDLLERTGKLKDVTLKGVSWKSLEAEKVVRLAGRIGIIDLGSVRWLKEQGSAIYKRIPKKTSYGNDVDYTPEAYQRYTQIDEQINTLNEIELEHRAIRENLYRELDACMAELETADTEAKVQKIHTRINGLNGQIALLEAYRNEANQKLAVQHMHNENQNEKELATNVERNLQESKEEAKRFSHLSKAIKFRNRH